MDVQNFSFKTSVSNPSFIFNFQDWGQNWELSVGTLDQRPYLRLTQHIAGLETRRWWLLCKQLFAQLV
jgi:hypothetical protein